MQSWPIADRWTLALLGPEGGKLTSGPAGNWEEIPVPRDRPITEWTGRNALAMDIDLLYDGWLQHPIRPEPPRAFTTRPRMPIGGNVRFSRMRGVWIEGMILSLEALATRQGEPTPTTVRVYGSVPKTEYRWVINNIEYGDAIRDRVTGRRMRQQVTVSLMEYNQPGDLRRLPRGNAKPLTSAYDW